MVTTELNFKARSYQVVVDQRTGLEWSNEADGEPIVLHISSESESFQDMLVVATYAPHIMPKETCGWLFSLHGSNPAFDVVFGYEPGIGHSNNTLTMIVPDDIKIVRLGWGWE